MFVLALLVLSMFPAFVGADHGGIHVEAVPPPFRVPLVSTGGWTQGTFHVTHSMSIVPHMVYDPVDGTWTNLSRPPVPRLWAGSAAIGPVLYTAGGVSSGGDPACTPSGNSYVCSILESYNASNRSWTRLPDMPTPRKDAGVAAVNGLIYVVGGVGTPTASRAVERYDPATNLWTTLPPLPVGRTDARSLTALDGRLYLTGGLDDTNNGTRTLLTFHPLLNVWLPLADLPVPMAIASAGHCDGKLLAFGGVEWDAAGQSGFADVVRQYDPLLNQWSVVADYPGWQNMGWGGSLTAGDLTMAVSPPHIGVHAFRCPTGTGAWETMADLVIDSLAFTTPNPQANDMVSFTATVRNRGVVGTGPTNLSFSRGNAQFGSVDVPGLAPGEIAIVAGGSWTAMGGNSTITAVVDVRGAVDEWNDDNNVRSQVLYVRGADLIIAGHSLAPPDAAPGDAAQVEVTVRNAGDGPATGSFRVLTSVAGDFQFPMPIAPALAAGAEVVILTQSFTVPAGAFTVDSRADYFDDVVEINETNNRLNSTLEGARPDLRPTDLAATASDLRDGDTAAFVATVANEGGHAAGAFRVRFLMDGATLSQTEIAGLAAGSQVIVTSGSAALAQGAHAVRVVVDDLDGVNESDETDNELETTIDVGPPRLPDLTIAELLIDPDPPRPGQRITTRAIVTNAGEIAIGATLVRFTRDGLPLGDATLPALAPGESATITAPQTWLAVPGTFTLRAVADPDATRVESDEANNARERSVTVGAAS